MTFILIEYHAIFLKPFWYSLREKCPYLELFWCAFSRIRTECGEIRSISPYSVLMRKNADQNNSEYAHFLRSNYHQIRPKSANPNIRTFVQGIQSIMTCIVT